MSSATKKNILLQAWAKTLEKCSGLPAIFSPDGEVVRRFNQIESEAAELELRFKELGSFGGIRGTSPENERQGQLGQSRQGGVAPGSVVAIQIGNSPSWPAILLAALRCGLIPLPLGRHIEKAERDLVFKGTGVSVLAESDESGQLVINQVPGNEGVLPGVNCDFLKLTSGTTSVPRCVRFTAGQLLADCINVCDTMGIGPSDLNFGVIPFSHSYGFSNLITPLICRGVALVASDDRMPRAILNGLAATRATVFPGMPVFFDKLAEMKDLPKLDALRLCISAGAPLTKAVGEKFTARVGLKIHTFYGASECGGMGYDASDEPVYEEGYLGTPMKNVAIESLGDDTIRVRSEAVGEGYYPEADSHTLADGHFIPSDLVTQTPRGMVLVGRASDIINVAGRKLNPLEVESQLMGFPGVRQAVVFGVPSSLRNEEAIACIAGSVDHDALHRFAQTRLSAWQMPKDFWFLEEIPVNERGKISRRELAEKYRTRQQVSPTRE